MTDPPVHFVVPSGIDDPRRPSGGNRYDRRLARELTAIGRRVELHRAPGPWPVPVPADQAALAALLADLPDGAAVLVDGLIGSAATALATEADRLRLVVLVHMPLAEAMPESATRERAVLRGAVAVVATSAWTRRWLIDHHGIAAERVTVAAPGVDPAPIADRGPAGARLLCVGPVVADKGHDLLLHALERVGDLPWHCTCVGALDLEPDFVATLRRAIARAGLADRVTLPGPLPADELDALRTSIDLAVSASRRDSFGMAVAEALARGIPALVSDAGGQPDLVGEAGVVVPAGDAVALATALRAWLTDPAARSRARAAAEVRRTKLAGWPTTARAVAEVLSRAVNPAGRPPVLRVQASTRGGSGS